MRFHYGFRRRVVRMLAESLFMSLVLLVAVNSLPSRPKRIAAVALLYAGLILPIGFGILTANLSVLLQAGFLLFLMVQWDRFRRPGWAFLVLSSVVTLATYL